MFLKKCGDRLPIGQYVRMQKPDCIEIGHNVTINDRGWIAANRDGIIVIKNDTLIGPGCIIHSGNHKFRSNNLLVRHQSFSFEKIEIGEDVWIGARVTILQGVKIGERAVAAAGFVITKNVESNYIVAGIPAKIIGKR